jgi:predicted ester cyclase
MSMENIKIVERLFDEAWGQGNLELIDEICAENFIDHDPLLGDADREGLKARIETYRGAFPDLRFTIEEIFASGDRVVVRWSGVGTFENELMGLAPTGEKGSPVGGIAISRFEDGKLIEDWAQWDTLRLMKNMGAVPEGAATPASS